MGLWVNYAILLFALLPLAQCLPSMSPPNQVTVGLHQELHNGSAVPGDSPAKYHNDPANDLFNIESLDLYPNPCVIESYCTVVLRGRFKASLDNATPHVSFNVTSHFNDGRTGLIRGEDDFCNWVEIVQDESTISGQGKKKQCPPKTGDATIQSQILILGGWVPEANYTVGVRVTDGAKTIFDLWMGFELLYKTGAKNMMPVRERTGENIAKDWRQREPTLGEEPPLLKNYPLELWGPTD